MIMIGICDDEQNCKDILRDYCVRIFRVLKQDCTYKMFSCGEEVLACESTIDILLMDINMRGIDGIDAMKELDNHDNIKNILFVSGYPARVFESFGTKTRGFVCKPVEYERFADEIENIMQKYNKSEIFQITEVPDTPCILSSDIVAVKAERKYVKIMTKKKSFTICGSLNEWKLKLEQYNVIQVHRSYLVNLDYVERIKDVVILDGIEIKIPVGRKYRSDCCQKYKDYIFKKFNEK